MKRVIITIICAMLALSQTIITAKADEENYTIDGYIVTYNGIEYDLSTEQGNYDLTNDNRELTAEEYVEILNQISLGLPINGSMVNLGNNINEFVPVDPGDGGGYTYFHSMGWIYRSDGWNLSLNPKLATRQTLPTCLDGWDEVVYFQSSNSNWYNADSLYGQYVCHFWFAPATKTYWNLSPAIPNKPAFQWVLDGCN